MSSPLLLKSASVWDGSGFVEEDLLIRGGVIARKGKGIADPKASVIDAQGMLALPGLVDLHAHVGEPAREDRESLASLLEAAAFGGFTFVTIMADTDPPIDDETAVRHFLAKADRLGTVQVGVAAALTKGRRGQELAELAQLARAGAVAFGDARPIADAEVMRRALEYAKLLSQPLLIDAQIDALSRGGVAHEGDVATRLGLAGIPAASEWIAVSQCLLLAEGMSGRAHLQGVSTKRSVELIREGKARETAVTAECSFHHLLLDHRSIADYDASTKLMPPLRSEEDRAALVEGVATGVVDCIVTDHWSAARHEKDVEFDAAPFGAVGLELALPAVYTRLVKTGALDWSHVVRTMSDAPRRILGLPQARLEEGAPADVALFHPESPWRVDGPSLRSKGANTPLDGETLAGRVAGVVVGDRLLGPLKEGWRP